MSINQTLVVIAYIATLFLLVIFTLWDVGIIIEDYVTDNRVISLKQKPIPGQFPFLKGSRLCLSYRLDSLFPIQPIKTENYLQLLVHRWKNKQDLFQHNLTDPYLDIANAVIDLTLAYMIISPMDYSGPRSLKNSIGGLTLNRSELITIIDKFLENPDIGNQVIKAGAIARPMFITDEEDNQDIYPTDMFGLNTICFNVPLSSSMSVTKSSQTYALDFVHNHSNGPIIPDAAFMIVALLPPSDKVVISGGPRNLSTINTLSISNTGIFDFTRFPPCTHNFLTEDDCLANLRRRIISETCRCTQFSHKLFQKLRNDSADSEDHPICTAGIYEQCWPKAMQIFEKEEEFTREKGTCKPCRHFKNAYHISSFTSTFEVIDQWSPRAYVRFECKDRMYLLFEGKQQLSPSQLISQIGGDLGLYIGFSMASLLQLIVFCYHWCQRRSESESTHVANRVSRWFHGVFQYIVMNADRSEEHRITRNWIKKQDEKIINLAGRMLELENGIKEICARLDQIACE